ncbi:transporter substrate-binding domain-containing protein [Clostridium niameyense]|uniref:Transporter substrate-binding domain-containing protein n=1 Tax=Clostridium niameyense TaxID=1622073 RepID=A0A6M0RB43_9CLOT|nr:transporter substrate-binding domain-containing protein [Clostridium niameyense]NEZ47453.1 transporter substrate-binding domain-containing protein [Clostridium niameyense]
MFPIAKTKKGDTLREKIDKSINNMRKDGTLKKLSNKWIGEDITTNKTKQ